MTENPDHVLYVWIDALSNYITGLDIILITFLISLNTTGQQIFMIGKDIVRFHTIYWPIILMALDLLLPKKVFGHPWVLIDKNKMSKSKGNTMYTDELVDLFGVDVVRYYLLHEIPMHKMVI